MRAVKMPYALDEEGHIVTVLTAPRHANYTCLACGQPLELRRRPGQRPHFRHRPAAQRVPLRATTGSAVGATTGSAPAATERSPACARKGIGRLPIPLRAQVPEASFAARAQVVAVGAQACLGERTTHLAAKRLLQEQVRQELDEQGGVLWHLRCAGVNGRCRDHATIPRRHVIQAWDAVELDVAHGPFRFDVAVTSQGRVVFGFELLFRHKASDAEAQATCVPWLELLTEDVLAFRPRVPSQSPLAEERCEVCKDLVARLAERKANEKARANTLAGDHRECPYTLTGTGGTSDGRRRCTGVDGAYGAEAKRVAGAWRAVLERARARA